MSPADSDVTRKRVGAVIRRRRQALGLEQRELAERVGVHVNSVQKWESGTHYPGRKLGKLEEVLRIRLDEPEPDFVPSRLRQVIHDELPEDEAERLVAVVEAALEGRIPPRRREPPRRAEAG